MQRQRRLALEVSSLAVVFLFTGCNAGPGVSGSFERSYPISGPLRIELNSASGDVQITGGSGNTVQVHADVTAHGMGFDDSKKLLAETISNPPIEQRGDTLRIGKDISRLRNISITYRITVPHETEVNSNVASGAQTIFQIRGPLKIQSASGSVRVAHIDRDAQLNSVSGSIDASDVGDDVRANTLAGNVSVSDTKGDVRAGALSGAVEVKKAGGRVDAETASGSVEVDDAVNDVKARSASGRVSVHGNPGATSYWQLTTVSGPVLLGVPSTANFHLTAEATSGEIRADIPIVVEEQSKHALRAHVGNGGGRVEVHTSSGEIRIAGANVN
jgi:DUF4097 and DUF4098 domain-containing protein YvlB